MQKCKKKFKLVDTCIRHCVHCTGWLKGEMRGSGLRESLFLAPYLPPRKANSRNITCNLPSSLAEIGDNDDAL